MSVRRWRFTEGLRIAALSCGVLSRDGATEPDASTRLSLFELDVQASIGLGTARVSFAYDVGCGASPEATVVVTSTEVTVEARSTLLSQDIACVGLSIAQRAEVTIVPNTPWSELRVVFRQPGGTDSVRTVSAVS